MNSRRLAGASISAIGLGCMNLSHAYGVPPDVASAERLLLHALDCGVTHFDTATLYGFGANEELVGRALGGRRREFLLASKCGIHGVPHAGTVRRVIDGRPATLRQNCIESLRRLRTEVIDLYYLHRWDKSVPVEESVGALAELVREGRIRAIGLSEVSAATLRRAHAVHPIAAVQSEYSLCTRNPEFAVLEACRELGAAFVAFSPVGRGFLTGSGLDVESLAPKDLRRSLPRFEPANHAANLPLQRALAALAAEAGCTPTQLALGWVLSRGDHVCAIPGTTSLAHLEENVAAGDLVLNSATLARLEAVFPPNALHGRRYNAATQAEIDTEDHA